MHPKELRSKYRRFARRLRAQKLEPRYKNLHSAEELAEIYERTVQRDEILIEELSAALPAFAEAMAWPAG